MEKYFEPVLSEEQMAAYLDGMLSDEENDMIEGLIISNPELMEIQDVIDSVDSNYIYITDDEIPIECIADDFSLPEISSDFNEIVMNYGLEDDFSDEFYDENSVYNEELSDSAPQEDNSLDDLSIDNEFEDFAF